MTSACALLLLLTVSSTFEDGGEPEQDATVLLEAAPALIPPEASFVPNTSDLSTLQQGARRALAAHQRLIAAVAVELPRNNLLSGVLDLRGEAVSAGATVRAALGDETATIATLSKQVNALARADRALSAELKSVIEKLQPTAVVVSGGVSLGAYQAGLLHYYSQYLLQHRIAVTQVAKKLGEEPMVATGASAGSVNAFLSALATCRKPVVRPEDSLFWHVWMPIGFDGLLNLEDVTTYSLLSRAPLDAAVKVVAERWNDDEWNDQACRLNVGLTVTREIPRSVALNTNTGSAEGLVRLPIQTERVILTLEGAGNTSPSIRSVMPDARTAANRFDFYVDWAIRTKQGEPFPASVSRILQASSAFPVAWPPLSLELNGGSSSAYFLDGGVFDNNPVRLAVRLLEWTGPGEKKLDVAQTRLRTRSLSRILYVEPDATIWQHELVDKLDRRSSFSAMYSQLMLSLIGTARKAELLSTLEYDESDTLRDRIDVPLRHWPITGAFMLNFFAFLEEDFRRFDFYSGMADAQQFLGAGSGGQRLGLGNVEVQSPEFNCVVAFRKAHGQSAARELPACQLLFTTRTDEAGRRHATNLLALLDTSAEVRAVIFECIREKNCEVGAEFKTLSSALPKHGFVFSDKGVAKDSVIAAVRDRLQPIISEFARRQPFPESAALAIGGKAALDSIFVRPSRWYLGVGMLSRSGAEAEYSRRVGASWRPFTFGLRVSRVQSRFLVALRAIAEEHYSGTVEAYWHPATFEGGFGWLTARWPWWLRLGVSGGMGAEVTTLEFTPAAYRFPASMAVTASLFQRVYLRFAVKQYVADNCPDSPCGVFSERSRADAVQLAGNTGDWMVSVGWRWID